MANPKSVYLKSTRENQEVENPPQINDIGYGWYGRDNEKERVEKFRSVNPGNNFYNPGDWLSNGFRYIFGVKRDDYSTPHEEALYKRYLGGERDYNYLPKTNIRFSKDYDINDRPFIQKEYTGLPKEQKDVIRNEVIKNIKDKLKSGKWTVIDDNIFRSKDQRGTGNKLSGLGKFGIRNNNDSGVYDVVDTYDFPSWIPIPDRNKGQELEIRDTIHVGNVNPDLYKTEKGYLPYNSPNILKELHKLNVKFRTKK